MRIVHSTRLCVGLVLGGLAATPRAQSIDPGIVELEAKVSAAAGSPLALDADDRFGTSVAALGDLDGDGHPDLAVGAPDDDDGGSKRGAVWILFLDGDGALKAAQKISSTQGGFAGDLANVDHFGTSLASLGDHDGDGVTDLAVGAIGDDNGGNKHGAVWVLFLKPDGTVKVAQKISATQGGFTGQVENVEAFGLSAGAIGDVDRDGVGDLAVGALVDDATGAKHGGVWILFLHADGTVEGSQLISATSGGFTGALDNVDAFGSAVTGLGDLDGNGTPDIAVGAPGDDDGGSDRGAVWVLFLHPAGTVAAQQKISATSGGFPGPLSDGDRFGAAIGSAGELDPDDSVDLAVGAPGDAGSGVARGAAWMLFLRADGTVEDFSKIADGQGGFAGTLADGDQLGAAVAAPGDLDGNGVLDLAAGAPGDDGSGSDAGATWILYLRDASQVPNPGSGTNPMIFHAGATPPGIGKTWDPVVVEAAEGKSLFAFLGVSREPSGSFEDSAGSFGELLISVAPGDFLLCASAMPGAPFQIPVPDDPILIGLPLFAQGALLGGPSGLVLANGLDIVIGI